MLGVADGRGALADIRHWLNRLRVTFNRAFFHTPTHTTVYSATGVDGRRMRRFL